MFLKQLVLSRKRSQAPHLRINSLSYIG